MHPVSALEFLGGIGTMQQLRQLSSRSDVDRCVASGDLIRSQRGRYVLPGTEESLATAHSMTGIVSHTSAALLWGWEVRQQPDKPHVTVRRGRRVQPEMRSRAHLHYAELRPDDIVDGRTNRLRTLRDCLAGLPLDDAMAVADSALRHRAVTHDALQRLAHGIRGPGAGQARFVAEHASALAANPFESALFAISTEVPGLNLQRQVSIHGPDGFIGRADLANDELLVIVEAESHSFHSRRGDLRRDCQRYTSFVLNGWLVLRFAWEDVMHERDYVLRELTRLRDLAVKLAVVQKAVCAAA